MPIYQAENVSDKKPAASPHSAGEVYVSDGFIDLTTAIDLDDLIELCVLPPKCVPLDLQVEHADLDSGASLTITAGLKTPAGTDLVANHNFFEDSAAMQAAGITSKEFVAASFENLRKAYSETDKAIMALKVTAAPAGGGTGVVRAKLTYRAVEQQDA